MNVTLEQNTVLTDSPRRDWKPTGWQGLSLQTPDAWNLVAFSGDRAQGSLRMDNGEMHGAAAGIEIRWSQIKGRVADSDLEKRLERYFGGIRKSLKRTVADVDAKSKAYTDARHPERTVSRTFTWRADRRASGRIWHCGECGRLVISQVTGAQGRVSSVASDVLRSLECHSREPGWQSWSLYDLATQLPTDYLLKGKPQLLNIYVQLPFTLGQSTESVTVEQWGVANVQLRGAYLNEWFRDKNSSQEPMLRYASKELTVQGHPALLLTGRRTGLYYWASQALPQLAKLQMPATHYAACLWECPETNKIHLVQSYSRRPMLDTVMQIVERTPCH